MDADGICDRSVELSRTLMDPYGPSFAALKTVCGALLKRPG